MAWLFETAGFQVCVLEGGYKAYRRHILESFSIIQNLLVLGGMTGSGKSLILRELARKGEQIIDLELLANHKGSAFGGIGHDTQPTNEQFENNLSAALAVLNPEKHTWIEDESRGIGRVQIPAGLFRNMRNAPVFFIEIPQQRRVDRLVNEYGELHRDVLILSIQQVSKRLGGLNTKTALEAIDKGEYKLAATILLTYYDKAYLEGLTKRNSEKVHHLECRTDDPLKNASRILKWKLKLENLSERA